MELITVPYKIDTKIETWQGNFTAEEIDLGLAGESTVVTSSHWYENINGEPVEITDEIRIQELESKIDMS